MPDLIFRDTDPNELREAITAEVVAAIRPLLAEVNEPRLVDGDRMAELAGVSRPTIDRAVRDNAIPSVRIGRRRLFEPRAVIDAFAQATKKATGTSGGESQSAPCEDQCHDSQHPNG